MRRVRVWCSVLFCWAILAVACADKTTETQKAVEEATEEGAGTVLDLWAGVPPLQPEADDIAKTLQPKAGPPKPKTIEEVVEVPFRAEPKGPAPAVPTGELKVLRFGPEGPQAVIDAIRVSFNQAMVPLASVEALRAKKVPLEIDPEPPGKVRWLGTDTVAFMADGRVPFSTTYKVTVPKGVEATSGATLDEAVTWEITTPVLALQSISPAELSTNVPLEPTIAMTFNQPVQRVPLLAALSLKGGGKTVELDELPVKDPGPMSDRVVQLKPKTPLRPNTRYTLRIPAGVFGEGPEQEPRDHAVVHHVPAVQAEHGAVRQALLREQRDHAEVHHAGQGPRPAGEGHGHSEAGEPVDQCELLRDPAERRLRGPGHLQGRGRRRG